MAQVDYIATLTREGDLLAQVETLDTAMQDVADYLQDRTMHDHFPVSVVMVDTDGRETTICTVNLGGN